VPKGVKTPPSLLNVYKSLESDPDLGKKFTRPKHGDLTNWANQGVFLLNNILTVEDSQPNIHKKEGKDFRVIWK
jgi:uracil-DNA glycosylase